MYAYILFAWPLQFTYSIFPIFTSFPMTLQIINTNGPKNIMNFTSRSTLFDLQLTMFCGLKDDSCRCICLATNKSVLNFKVRGSR